MRETTAVRYVGGNIMSVSEWVVTLIVLAIPIVGWIMYLVWAFGNVEREDRANYCKASLLVGVIGFALAVLFAGLFQ
jgi:hypothetical protein